MLGIVVYGFLLINAASAMLGAVIGPVWVLVVTGLFTVMLTMVLFGTDGFRAWIYSPPVLYTMECIYNLGQTGSQGGRKKKSGERTPTR